MAHNVRGRTRTWSRLTIGPTNCYSAVYFESTLAWHLPGAGLHIRTKDQDFAISRRLYIKASHSPDFSDPTTADTYIADIATVIKTNLDKTMFQKACATARDLRIAVPAAKYFLMAEWLDMTPISTSPTGIEEVLLLRKGKRIGSAQRQFLGTSNKRKEQRAFYEEHLNTHPFRPDVFTRWANHIRALLADRIPEESHVLEQGYF